MIICSKFHRTSCHCHDGSIDTNLEDGFFWNPAWKFPLQSMVRWSLGVAIIPGHVDKVTLWLQGVVAIPRHVHIPCVVVDITSRPSHAIGAHTANTALPLLALHLMVQRSFSNTENRSFWNTKRSFSNTEPSPLYQVQTTLTLLGQTYKMWYIILVTTNAS